MQEITDWLTTLGLPEYAGAFAENGIDVSVLPHLTDQDLKDIGRLSSRLAKRSIPHGGFNLNKSATHIGLSLKKTHTAHVAYGTLHRFERTLFDCSKQLEQLLAQVSPELRDQLANIDKE